MLQNLLQITIFCCKVLWGSTVLLEILLHVELVWGSFGASSGLERGEGLRLGVLGILDPLPGF